MMTLTGEELALLLMLLDGLQDIRSEAMPFTQQLEACLLLAGFPGLTELHDRLRQVEP